MNKYIYHNCKKWKDLKIWCLDDIRSSFSSPLRVWSNSHWPSTIKHLFLNEILTTAFNFYGFLTSSSATRLSHRQVTRLMSAILHAVTQRQSGETMTSVWAGHLILTPTRIAGGKRAPVLEIESTTFWLGVAHPSPPLTTTAPLLPPTLFFIYRI